jgi:hypothetical protein
MTLGRVFALSLAVSCVSCGGVRGVYWERASHLRTYPPSPRLWAQDADAVQVHGVRPKLHYVTLAIRSIFLRDVVGLRAGDWVRVGVRIDGAELRPWKVPVGAEEVAGDHRFVSIEDPLRLGPFFYEGRPLRVEIVLALGRRETLAAAGRTRSIQPMVVDPTATDAEAQRGRTSRAYEPVFDALYRREHPSFSVTLNPPEPAGRASASRPFQRGRLGTAITHHGGPSPGPLVAGRHVFLAAPAADAPKRVRAVTPERLAPWLYVGARGLRLRWTHSREEFTETPYVVIDVERHARHPGGDHRLTQAMERLRTLVSENHPDARAQLQQTRQLIHRAPVVTRAERNLALFRCDLLDAELDRVAAKVRGDARAQYDASLRQAQVLTKVLGPPHDARGLAAAEVQETHARLLQLRASIEALAKVAPGDEAPYRAWLSTALPSCDAAVAGARAEADVAARLAKRYARRPSPKGPPPRDLCPPIGTLRIRR